MRLNKNITHGKYTHTNYDKNVGYLQLSIFHITLHIYYPTLQIILCCLQKGPQDLSNYLLTTTVPSIVKVSMT